MDEYHPIRRLRLSLGMTQAEFGARVGLSAVRVCQIETSGAIGAENALRIADEYRREMKRGGLTLENLLRKSESAA